LDAVKILKPEIIIMASRWVPSLVALDIKAARQSTQDTLMRFANSFREMSVANPRSALPASTVFVADLGRATP
jgi:hypothetical protein